MMFFQLLSDLHLETHPFYEYPIPADAPNLFLLGDIGNIVDLQYFKFLRTQLLSFERVFLVLGNHEPWGSSWEESVKAVEDFGREWNAGRGDGGRREKGEFVFLNRRRYDFPEDDEGGKVTVLGCTLFSNILPEEKEAAHRRIRDFDHIANWDMDSHCAAFERDYTWLRSAVLDVEEDRTIMLVSHYAPTLDPRSIEPQFRGGSTNSCYGSDLKDMARREAAEKEGGGRDEDPEGWWGRLRTPIGGVVAWGHSHFNCDFVDLEEVEIGWWERTLRLIGWVGEEQRWGRKYGVRCLANQRGGGERERKGFKRCCIYEI